MRNFGNLGGLFGRIRYGYVMIPDMYVMETLRYGKASPFIFLEGGFWEALDASSWIRESLHDKTSLLLGVQVFHVRGWIVEFL